MKSDTTSGKNPIYIQYYSHEHCNCYKIDLPWPRYKKDTMVLCRVDEGIELAIERAKSVMLEHVEECLRTYDVHLKGMGE